LFNRKQYYFGSYGLVRGYGPLYRTIQEADQSVFADGREQRRHGGSTDRNAVAVSTNTGLCWWVDEEDPRYGELLPVKTPSGAQAAYPLEVIQRYEGLWGGPAEIAGFG
jgi:hypothetical protein